jgi:hypothetical protein
LVLAVLLAHGLGQWHRVAHGGPGVDLAQVASAWTAGLGDGAASPPLNDNAGHAGHGHAHDHAHGHGHGHGDSGLFGQHGEPECRLYDQLACADVLPPSAPPAWLPVAHSAGLRAWAHPTAWLSPRYQRPARAPPLA